MSFSLDLSKAIKNISGDVVRVMRGTLTQLSVNIIKSTPIGNPALWAPQSLPAPEGYVGGTLRGGWNASFGSPDRSMSPGRIETNDSGGQTAVNAAKVASTYDLGETFYLTNPYPHARPVEFGWSSQRPMGMLRVNLMQAQRVMDSIK